MATSDAICIVIVVLLGLTITLDFLGAGFAALRKKPYKSMMGEVIKNLSDRHAVWWLPISIALLFAYGLFFLVKL